MIETESSAGSALINDTLREYMAQSSDYIFVKDKDLVYCGGSAAFATMAGLADPSCLPGKTDLDIFPADIAEKYRSDDRALLEKGKTIDGILERLPDLDGKQRWTRTWKYAIHDPDGRIIGLLGIGRDVSDEVRLSERIKTADDYIGLINNIPCGVAIVHEDGGRIILDMANDGFMKVHHHRGEPFAALIGSDVMPYVFEEDRQKLLDEYARVKADPTQTGNADYRFRGSDGTVHWVNLRLRAAYAKDGISYYYAAYSGLDTQKQIELRLEDSLARLEESVLNTDLQFFTYYPGHSRCENLILNGRFSQLPTVWENYPDDFLEYTQCPDADARDYRRMLAAIDKGEETAQCTVRFMYKGSYIWEQVVVRAVRDAGGQTIRAQGHSINVTEKIRSQDRLRKERVRLKTLSGSVFESFSFDLTKTSAPEIQTKDEGMAGTVVSGELMSEALSICPALADTNPQTREVLLKAAARIPDAGDRALFISTCSGDSMREGVKKGHYSAEIRYRRYVGDLIRRVQTDAEILPDPDNGDLIAFYYTKDVTEEVIRELITAEIVEKNYACVSCLDLQSGIFSVISGTDSGLHSLNGMKYSETLLAAAEKFVAQEDVDAYKSSLMPEKIIEELKNKKYYTVFNRRKELAQELPGKPHRRMKNDIFYLDCHHDTVVFLLTDVTGVFEAERESRDKLETALMAAKQASSAKSNFLSRMSHEIRTPLNAIIGMDTIAAQSIGDPDKTADCISKIGLSARYLLSLINDILDMSRIESGKMLLKNESFSFPEFVSGVNNIIYPQVRAKGIDFECTVAGDVADSYIGDEMKLQQVLVNVLGNAVKFTAKGKISLDVSVLSREGSMAKLRFVVSDTGCGISEKDQKRIFEAFEQVDTSTTTVYGGTGLGLAITKNLIGLMGGMISVRSIVGVGSEFTIDVPLTADDTVPLPLTAGRNLANMYTLIVDDDLLICEQTQDILKGIGMIGEWVTSGREAVDRVRTKKDAEKYYDFILIDWKMPDMDGIETTREIRSLVGPDVTIIIISAYDWQSIEAEARAAGANMMISKPLLRSTLVSAFERALGEEKAAADLKTDFDFTGKRVLVAEDNDLNAEIAKALLEAKHFTVDRVPNGLRALECFVQSPEGTYDAILMDVRMPMMDGLQTTVNIRHWDRADAKTIPIIAMTANAFDEDVEKSHTAGMNAHLSKPIDPELMYSTLYHMIFPTN